MKRNEIEWFETNAKVSIEHWMAREKKTGEKDVPYRKNHKKRKCVCCFSLSRIAYRRYASLNDHQHKLHTISKHHFDRNVYGYYTSQAKNIDIFPYPNQVGGRKTLFNKYIQTVYESSRRPCKIKQTHTIVFAPETFCRIKWRFVFDFYLEVVSFSRRRNCFVSINLMDILDINRVWSFSLTFVDRLIHGLWHLATDFDGDFEWMCMK